MLKVLCAIGLALLLVSIVRCGPAPASPSPAASSSPPPVILSPTSTPATTPLTTTPPPSEPEIQKLPYSWTEGVLEITVHGVVKSDVQLEKVDRYLVRMQYKNTSHETAPMVYLHPMNFKLKTDIANIYHAETGIGWESHKTFLPGESYEDAFFMFEVWKGEMPIELWLYDTMPGSGALIEESRVVIRLAS